MSEPRGSLIYLMQFLEGQLSAPEADAARRRLEAADWQSAWERLQLAAIETPLPVTTWEEPAVPAETLAAFLEGSLSLDEAARIERQCWSEPGLLREVVSTYRFMHASSDSGASADELRSHQPTDRSTDRLLALLPDTPSQTSSSAFVNRIATEPSANHSSESSGPSVEIPVVVNASQRSNRLRRRRTPIWVPYAATMVIGLVLGVAAVVAISLSGGAGQLREDIVSPSEGELPLAPDENTEKQIPDPTTPEPQRPLPETPTPQLPTRPFDVASEDPSPPSSTAPLPGPTRPQVPTLANDNPTPQDYPSFAVEWETIDGLLVARNDATQPWQGPHAEVQRSPTATYATLPESWASAKTNHGRIVLAADTQVQLGGTRDAIHMNVERGNVAISEIPPNQTVHLQAAKKSWIIQPIEADTSIGMTVFARQSQLVVRRGRISINGTEIGNGRQVVLGDDGLAKPTAIKSSIKWFTRPKQTLKLPAATRTKLLASRNVRADLATIWRTPDDPARFLAARWSLAIGVDQTLAQALSSPDAQLRLAATQWLLSCEPNDPRVTLALRRLAAITGNRQSARNVMSWLQAAHDKKGISRTDAEQMIAGLRSDHLAIRHISAFFLETAFGKHVSFDPTAGPAARQKAAREWNALLQRADRVNRP